MLPVYRMKTFEDTWDAQNIQNVPVGRAFSFTPVSMSVSVIIKSWSLHEIVNRMNTGSIPQQILC